MKIKTCSTYVVTIPIQSLTNLLALSSNTGINRFTNSGISSSWLFSHRETSALQMACKTMRIALSAILSENSFDDKTVESSWSTFLSKLSEKGRDYNILHFNGKL